MIFDGIDGLDKILKMNKIERSCIYRSKKPEVADICLQQDRPISTGVDTPDSLHKNCHYYISLIKYFDTKTLQLKWPSHWQFSDKSSK